MKYLILFLSLLNYSARCQNVNNFFDAYIGTNAQGYLQPLADLTIGGLNTGIQPSIRIGDRFNVRLTLNTVSMFPDKSQKTFMGVTPDEFTPKTTTEVPTIIGDPKNVRVAGVNGTSYAFSGGYGITRLSWVTPQLSFGGFFGSEISLRFMTFGNADTDFGKFSQLGVGLRHSISQYFLKKDSPFDINIGYQFNKADIGKYIKLQSNYAFLQAGVGNKNIGAFVYGGYQMGNFDVSYTGEDNKTETVNLKNQFPVLVGVGTHIQLGFLSLTLGVGGVKPIIAFGNIGFRFQSKSKPVKP
ncbi:DUF6588 family protein [Emticicia sp. BO119]|uniref:DUF6588 family protein n=1 Tax=Emticicia sp. BO119 TaxID=2757768 RepID=UPI0015F08693|nr:DUF6588 family protein [Emticicia sp. BO119]MBA4849627.1 hypothetical protein [Emticicia sp. BO119]